MIELSVPKPTTGNLAALWQKHGSAIVTALCLLFTVFAWIAGRKGSGTWEIGLYLLAYLIGGYQKALEGLETLFKEKELDVDLLMVIAAIGAAAIGHWLDGAILIFIFSLSGTLEDYSMEKTNRNIQSLMSLLPEEAVLLENGRERKVRADTLQPADVILVRPGERIAADGIIIAGYSSINLSPITGEPLPVDKAAGDEVYSGAINGQGAIEIEVIKPSAETMLAKIIHLVQEAKTAKPPGQLFVERFESVYAKVVVLVAILLMVLPPFVMGWSWQDTIYRAMIFLVVASPCALVSSIMPAILSAISNAAKKGVLFKGGVHLQNIADVNVVAFDKTGTLTVGQPRITDIVPFEGLTAYELLRLTASVETLSEHPIAKAIVQAAHDREIPLERPTALQAVHGLGVFGSLGQIEYAIGKQDILKDVTIEDKHQQLLAELENQGKNVVFVTRSSQLIGLITIQDHIRSWAGKIVEDLKGMGIKVVMLTGDTLTTAKAIGKKAGIDEIYANLLPEKKLNMVRELEKKYGKVAMVGDGVNDAPALAAATVGIAVASGGTDVAIETADIVLMSDNIEKIPFAISLGRRTSRVIKQNVVFAVAVALVLVTLNFVGGIINLPEGVVGHEGSTVLVILSGLRLLR